MRPVFLQIQNVGNMQGNNAPFENASGKNNVLHVSNANDETRNNIPDEVSELSVPETHFDRQTHTHHSSAYPDSNVPDSVISSFTRRSFIWPTKELL